MSVRSNDAPVFESDATRTELLCKTRGVIDDDHDCTAGALLDQGLLEVLCARLVEPRPWFIQQ